MNIRVSLLQYFCAIFAILVIASCAENTTPINPGAARILVLGNSLTRHEPLPAIDWHDDWGMAASALERDYVHILKAEIFSAVGDGATLEFFNIAKLAQQGAAYFPVVEALIDNFKPDIAIVQIGDNVVADDGAEQEFSIQYRRLIGTLVNVHQAQVVCTSTWFLNPTINATIQAEANVRGIPLIDIRQIYKDTLNQASSERTFTFSGVGAHPGDRGMRLIAEAIWGELQPLL